MKRYLPEGFCYKQTKNREYINGARPLRQAFEDGEYLEARPYMCDALHNLHFRLGAFRGFMPYEECAEGISEGTVRDIAVISRVNKPTGFYITSIELDGGVPTALLSRTKAQSECRRNYISKLVSGDVIDAAVTHIEPFGAFCDIGCGIPALLPIDSISVSRIPTPFARFRPGDFIKVAVRSVEDKKVTLTHKELLGTWRENAELFNVGETVTGTVRSVESYGIFVELTPNLAGLAEYVPGVCEGQTASVFIKSINPEKMKIKLIIIDSQNCAPQRSAVRYFISEGRINFWQYSPDGADRNISTSFT